MLKHTTLALGLLISTGVFASNDMNSIINYASRTAKDYCNPRNTECINEFSSQVIIAFKDGEQDSSSRYSGEVLSKRYEKRLVAQVCVPSDTKHKDACLSMVDRLVDSYNRGLNSK